MFKYRNGGVNTADRFIPCRKGMNVDALNYMLLEQTSTTTPEREIATATDANPNVLGKIYTNKSLTRWRRKMLEERIWSTIPMPKRLLNFSSCKRETSETIENRLWPVNARKRPLIGAPTIVLDMPYLEGNICHNIIDWGCKGYLASVFEGDVYLWHIESKNPYMVTNIGEKVEKCIRWNHDANRFAMALKKNGIGVYDVDNTKMLHESVCSCMFMCNATSFCWTKSNNLLAGCSFGTLTVFDSRLISLKVRFVHMKSIIRVDLSHTERYLATSGTDGRVRIWKWPEIEEHFEIQYQTPVRALSWNPWKNTLLAVGGGFADGSISIWNVTNYKQISYKEPTSNVVSCIDSLTWSSLTGELVVSYCQHKLSAQNNITESKSSVVILSNLDKEVDSIEWHTGRVLYLLWGENGSKLITASTDENACIWNFLGNSKFAYQKTNIKRRRPPLLSGRYLR